MSDQTVEAKTSEFALMNQLPDSSIQGESPLHHVGFETLAEHGPKTGGVVLRELKLLGHLTLRCNPESKEQLTAAKKILGVDLPLAPLTSDEKDGVSVRWIAPDEWLILVPGDKAYSIEASFRNNMPGHYSIVNSSGGSTVLQVSGDQVVDMLKRCTPVDLHIKEFPVGKVVSTVFAKSGAVIRRTGNTQFELVIRRSFADYIWLWIQDASQSFGLVIEK
ncbi:MAG: sarcosine oxidase subunit gamma family protein [Reinekea sp.]|jgi:sarcosine oxidase, subunit gamma